MSTWITGQQHIPFGTYQQRLTKKPSEIIFSNHITKSFALHLYLNLTHFAWTYCDLRHLKIYQVSLVISTTYIHNSMTGQHVCHILTHPTVQFYIQINYTPITSVFTHTVCIQGHLTLYTVEYEIIAVVIFSLFSLSTFISETFTIAYISFI